MKTVWVSPLAPMKSSRPGKNRFFWSSGRQPMSILSSENQYLLNSPALSRFLEWRNRQCTHADGLDEC